METISRAGAHEGETVAELVKALLEEIMAGSGARHFAVEAEALAALCWDLLAREDYAVLLARREEEAVGVATLSECRALYAGGCFGILTELYVRPAHRGAGLGARLVEAARAFGRTRGWARLEVTTPPLPAFEGALRFYEAHGFEVTGGRKLKRMLP